MPGEAHVNFTAFSSGRKALVMFCIKEARECYDFFFA